MSKRIELGSTCRDVVTGFVGVATARTEWQFGCERYTLQPVVGKDGKIPDAATFDVDSLVVVKAPSKRRKASATGGPRPEPVRRAEARR